MIQDSDKIIKNSKYSEGRKIVLELLEAGINAVEPKKALEKELQIDGDFLKVRNKVYNLKKIGKLIVVGGGKASGHMAEVVEKILGNHITKGLVICNQPAKTKKIKVVVGTHPIPSEKNVEATREMLELLDGLKDNDLVISLISGGGSALMIEPVKGISLEQYQKLTEKLLKCGATIQEINSVRKHISKIKGGRLAQRACPAQLLSLIISDVNGDPLDVIASGPTAADPTTFVQAINSLKRCNLIEDIPVKIKEYLIDGTQKKVHETLKPNDPCFKKVFNLIFLNNTVALNAIQAKAREYNINVSIKTNKLVGEAQVMGRKVLEDVEIMAMGTQKPFILLYGGETTVTIKGKGKGGRNQEFVLGALEEMQTTPGIVVASIGTDGIDGPTDAAGAIADSDSAKKAKELGLDIGKNLDDNSSYPFFEKMGDLLKTGPTNTNVMDIVVIYVGNN